MLFAGAFYRLAFYNFKRAGGFVFFAQQAVGDQGVNVHGDRRDRLVVERTHDFTVTGAVTVTLYKTVDICKQFALFFTWPCVLHVFLLMLLRLCPTIRLTPCRRPKPATASLCQQARCRWQTRLRIANPDGVSTGRIKLTRR